MNKFSFLLALSILVYGCESETAESVNTSPIISDANKLKVLDEIGLKDTLGTDEFKLAALSAKGDSLRIYYRRTIICEYIGYPRDTVLTDEELETDFEAMDDLTFEQGEVIHSPDTRFIILVYKGEACGAYCNSIWESFIVFESAGHEISRRMNFNDVSEVVDMMDGNYLIMETSFGRTSSAHTVQCGFVSLLTFEDTNVIALSAFEGETSFGYCQEMNVDMNQAPYIEYFQETAELDYHYGNNYEFSHGIDVDTLRNGVFSYHNGLFTLEFEDVQVYSRERK